MTNFQSYQLNYRKALEELQNEKVSFAFCD